MATREEEAAARQGLEDTLDTLLEIDPESLVREDELGQAFSFKDGLPVFRRTLELFEELAECDFTDLPHSTLEQLNGQAEDALKRLQAIKEFDPASTDQPPGSERDSLIEQLQNRWDTYHKTVMPVVGYLQRRGMDFDALERQARGTLSELEDAQQEFEKRKDHALVDINEALEKVREAAAEAGVSQQAIYFGEEAESHENASWWWLGSAAAFGAATLLYTWKMLEPRLLALVGEASASGIVSAAIPRLVIVSILTFGIIWSARNFARNRHNMVVNRHRRNALSTFETFVKASSDPQTKDAVLIQATRSIFAPQPSGYSSAQQEPRQGNQIVEILTRMAEREEG